MKKKFLSLLFILCLIIPFAFAMSGCKETPPTNTLTADELSQTYKNIALGLWDSVGVSDPTAETVAVPNQLSVTFPEITTETTTPSELANIEINASTTAGIFYMISLLYKNENFALTNNIACFDATCTITTPHGDQTQNYTFTIKPVLDIENNKVYLELTSLVAGMTQYSYMEMSYNFDTNTLNSYKFYSLIVEIEQCVGMALTADGKYLFKEAANNTDEFYLDIVANKDAFVASAQGIEKLTTKFNTEMQAYFDVLSKVLADLNS